MDLNDKLVQEAVHNYEKRFWTSPKWVVAAPGRVNLIGEHTDYNGGFVFPMGIERYTVIAAGPRSNTNQALVYSDYMDKEVEIKLNGIIPPSEQVVWYSYIQGTVACALEKELTAEPFQAVVHSNVPLGGGLSSSASLEVATATLLEAISEKAIDPIEKALLCQKAEHVFAKMPCGIMDQFISAMAEEGKAMLLDCRSHKTEMIPMDDPDIVVLITNSNVKHKLTGSEYPERRYCCEEAARILGVSELRDVTLEQLEVNHKKLGAVNENYYRRAHHVVTEDERTLAMAHALLAKDWKHVGQLMYASHDSLKNDFAVSCPEIDILVDIAHSIGIEGGMLGSRITGGGFGGCTVSLVRADYCLDIQKTIEKRYMEKTGILPTIFSTRPAAGAMRIQ